MAHKIVETFETASGNRFTLLQVVFGTGGVQYYGSIENAHGRLIWSKWFPSIDSARSSIALFRSGLHG